MDERALGMDETVTVRGVEYRVRWLVLGDPMTEAGIRPVIRRAAGLEEDLWLEVVRAAYAARRRRAAWRRLLLGAA